MASAKRPNVNDCETEFDDEDPEGYRAGMFRPGPELGAQETGMSVYDLPPGQAICPYHYEWAEEEWIVVVSGRPTLRTPAGEEELKPGDVAFFERGPAGAHKVSNATDEPARVVMFSSLKWPAATVYPDSDKVGIFPAPGGEERLLVRRSSGVDYFDGET